MKCVSTVKYLGKRGYYKRKQYTWPKSEINSEIIVNSLVYIHVVFSIYTDSLLFSKMGSYFTYCL